MLGRPTKAGLAVVNSKVKMQKSKLQFKIKKFQSPFILSALFIGAFFVVPLVSFAAEIDAIIKVNHDGVDIYYGDTVHKEDFANSTYFWDFTFVWPTRVRNEKTLFAIIRGMFGNVEGGAPQEYINYSTNTQTWVAATSTIEKNMGSYGFTALGHASTTSSMHTVMIAEREQAFDLDTDSEIVEWFRTGGTSGVAPRNHAFLTFNYVATPRQNISLSYAEEEGFMTDTDSAGVHPNKGTASTTPMVFKVIYKNTGTPSEVNVLIGDGSATTSYPMTLDTATASTTLRDNIFTNGEQYTFAQTFPKGDYAYYFEAQSASTTVRLPAQTDVPSTLTFQTGYSNVAFLPGLLGSRLYQQQLFENKLWEPNRNADVEKLYLTDTGESVNQNIYTNDIIDEAFGFNVYKEFSKSMNDLVNNGTINAWQPMPYDWRADIEDIVNNDVLLNNNITYNIAESVAALAESSANGKVTIIAHSNGGLLGKLLISKLEAEGKSALVDKFIMVGAPQLGTPSAIIGLLHGGERGVLKGWLPNHEVTRELSENMQSAYNLLPSAKYFEKSRRCCTAYH